MFRTDQRFIVALVLAATAFGGCDSSGGSGGADAVDATGTVQSQLSVVLKEYSIATDVQAVRAGPVTFVVDNAGYIDHEMVVLRTDLALEDLPRDADGGVEEDGPGVQVIGEIEDVGPGKGGSTVLDLQPGRHMIICNITQDGAGGHPNNHFVDGMVATFQAL